jgi:chorismate mutase / prephenate dehydratase
MSPTPAHLADLRRDIDEIDDCLHDLLIKRAEVVSEIAASKTKDGDIAFYQPGREAEILRRLAARHHGALPFATVVRIWRETLAATVRLETAFSVAVLLSLEAQGFWDLARDHYGSQASISGHQHAGSVIAAVTEGRATVGVLPMPQECDPDPWWRHLLSQRDGSPRVIARLPFGAHGNARTNGTDALVIGRAPAQETGADRTFFGAQSTTEFGRARFLHVLSSVGLRCTFFASCERSEGIFNLIEIDGFVPATDSRIPSFRAQLGAAQSRLMPLGGYALPLPAAALFPEAATG